MTTTITSRNIFELNQVLTLAKAKELHGKTIACTSAEYKGNAVHVTTFIVGDVISEWDDAATRAYPDQHGKYTQYATFQEYWQSYMTVEQIDERKTTLLLLDSAGEQQFKAHTKYFNFYEVPTFTGSDADREVYYMEVG